MSFESLGIGSPIVRALRACHYANPTPIQAAAIPPALRGEDILGSAQTGTGKTASFALPILQRLQAGQRSGVRAMILAPTRELASQIQDSITAYAEHLTLTCALVIGGVGFGGQESVLRRGVDIVIATPGRLLDHLNRGTLSLRHVEIAVLDEADRMLDMGFIRDIRRIFAQLPRQRQTMLFSATLSHEVTRLARELLRTPVRVQAAPPASTPTQVRQAVVPVPQSEKRPLMARLLASPEIRQAIVFTRTKRGADALSRHLEKAGHEVAALHGNKSQSQRTSALKQFRDGRVRVLVATDIAARGLDVEGVTHVFNYEIPNTPADYVHRIGRTGRAAASGVAISLMSEAEKPLVNDIEKLMGMAIPQHALGKSSSAAPAARIAILARKSR